MLMKENYPSYYLELRPEKRKALLPDEDFSEEERSFAEKLWNCRYKETKGTYADLFLAQCMELTFLYGNTSPIAFFSDRKVKAVLNTLQADTSVSGTDMEKHLLYLEYYNTALCYLDTCKASGYRTILGIARTSDNFRQNEIRKDIYEMTEGPAKHFHIENELSLWNKAFQDALAALSE